MNFDSACMILDINPKEKNWKHLLKRKYHKKALKYHPDKNNTKGSEEKFQEVHEAYEFLLEYENKNYENILTKIFLFIYSSDNFDEFERYDFFIKSFQTVINVCEFQGIQIIDNMNEETFSRIYKMFVKYRSILYLSEKFCDFMEKKKIYWFSQGNLKKRHKRDVKSDYITDEDLLDENKEYETIVSPCWDINYYMEVKPNDSICDDSSNCDLHLKPSLDDVMGDNVFKHTLNENDVIYIPLWHNELVYDNSGNDFIVRVTPKLPSNNYWIDEDNNLHQKVEYTLYELWDSVNDGRFIEIFFGRKKFIFYPERLNLKSNQIYIWKGQGISKINTFSAYDISLRSNVVLHVIISGMM